MSARPKVRIVDRGKWRNVPVAQSFDGHLDVPWVTKPVLDACQHARKAIATCLMSTALAVASEAELLNEPAGRVMEIGAPP